MPAPNDAAPILLIDGNNLLLRNYHMFQDMRTSEGLQLGAVHGYTNSLKKLLRDFPEYNHIVVWDSGEHAAWRVALYPNYKQREHKPVEGESEPGWMSPPKLCDLCRQLNKFLGICDIQVQGIEADDIISLMVQAYGGPICVLSTDRDFLQLVQPRLFVRRPIRPVKSDTDNRMVFHQDVDLASFKIITEYDTPISFLIGKALFGDDSDCITGVKGVGEITAKTIMAGAYASNSFAFRISTAQALLATHAYIQDGFKAGKKSVVRDHLLAAWDSVVLRNIELMDLSLAWTRIPVLIQRKIAKRILDNNPVVDTQGAMTFLRDLEIEENFRFNDNLLDLVANRRSFLTEEFFTLRR